MPVEFQKQQYSSVEIRADLKTEDGSKVRSKRTERPDAIGAGVFFPSDSNPTD